MRTLGRGFVFLCCLAPAPAVHAQEEDPLRSLVAEHTHAVTLEDGRLRGPGAEHLRSEMEASHFFLFGEQHATADIARVGLALWKDCHDVGYDHMALEVGPHGTRRLEQILRQGGRPGLESFLREQGNPLLFPFAFFAEEAELLAAVVADSDDPMAALWGLDQEFIAGGAIVLERLEALATTDDQRAAVAAARQAAGENPMWLGVSEPAAFAELQSVFVQPGEAHEMVEAIVLSNSIYAPFTGRGGTVHAANDTRERLMKTHFARAFHRTREFSGEPPRVFLKFGANHLAAGHSPTHVLTLGNFVRELAQLEGLQTYALHVDCQGGQTTDPRSGDSVECESFFLGEGSDLGALLPDTPMAMVDLRALRPSLPRLADWDERSRDLLLAYDAVLFVRDVSPAGLLVEGE